MTDYNSLCAQARGLIGGVSHLTANLSNLSALINENLSDINWAGFYLLEGDRLVLGPFQGKVACIEIPVGRGVCGTAVSENKTQRVANVHEFKGHIACDSASNSEIVLPIRRGGKIVCVLDIDSTSFSRFTEADEKGLTELVKVIEEELHDLF